MNSKTVEAGPGRRAAQLLVAIVSVLVLGKLIAVVPVMGQLRLLESFTASEIIHWFGKSIALVLFFFFVRHVFAVLSDDGGPVSFLKRIAEPVAILIVAIVGQALLWQLFEPFVDATGRTIYFSAAVVLIVAVSAWLVVRAYRNAWFVVDACNRIVVCARAWWAGRRHVCERCKAEVDSGASFCSRCGHKLTESLTCRECGKAVSAEHQYCRYCGSKIQIDS